MTDAYALSIRRGRSILAEQRVELLDLKLEWGLVVGCDNADVGAVVAVVVAGAGRRVVTGAGRRGVATVLAGIRLRCEHRGVGGHAPPAEEMLPLLADDLLDLRLDQQA